jgi:hypothetical protein
VTVRYLSRLHHIGLGRAHAGEAVCLLIANKDIRVIHEDGSLIRQLTLDPSRDYQARGRSRLVLDDVRQASTMS